MSFRTKIFTIVLGVLLLALAFLAISQSMPNTHSVEVGAPLDATGQPLENHEQLFAPRFFGAVPAYAKGGWPGLASHLEAGSGDDAYLVLDSAGIVRVSKDARFLETKATLIENSWELETNDGDLRLRLSRYSGGVLQFEDGTEAWTTSYSPIALTLPNGGDVTTYEFLWGRAMMILISVALIAWFITKKALAPMKAVSLEIDKLRQGDETAIIPVEGRDEVAQFGESLNLLVAEQRHNKQVRQSLLTDLAHELRTPLTSIRCQAETLADGLKPASQENLTALLDGVVHLQGLYCDLEALALADADQLPITIEPLDVRKLLLECCQAAAMQQDAPQFDLEYVTPGLKVNADKKRLQQVVLNLLSNAARFSAKECSVRITAQKASEGAVHIEVIDQGPGIGVEDAESVFKRFYRADITHDPNEGGHGLGLAIARRLARLMDGDVVLLNAGSMGAHFRASVPAKL